MDLIREQLLYNQNLLTICLGKLSSQEQYECIRLLVASRTEGVSICVHSETNPYILELVKKLNLTLIECPVSSQSPPVFDLRSQ
jgi:hypothetical protein